MSDLKRDVCEGEASATQISGIHASLKLVIVLGDGRWTADGYVTIIVYLHQTPVTPSPWNTAYNVMITVDRPWPSRIGPRNPK